MLSNVSRWGSARIGFGHDFIIGVKIEQEPRHCLSLLSSIHGRHTQMPVREFPLLLTPFMEWLLSIGQRATKYGEGVALLAPFSQTLLGL